MDTYKASITTTENKTKIFMQTSLCLYFDLMDSMYPWIDAVFVISDIHSVTGWFNV